MYVTSPLMPDFDEFVEKLRPLWRSRNLTNNGPYLREFEQRLADYLDVPYVSVMCNGTLPIMLSLKAVCADGGEVITTPYTFVATVNAIEWSGLTPVFADVNRDTCTLSPQAVEAMITPRTRAILPVHVYGYPCNIEGFRRLSEKYSIPVIYDAAHAFGVKKEGRSILTAGELSTLSFHATKIFNTLEGGAVVCKTSEMKHRLDTLRNFGITSETTVESVGVNAKLDELRAAFGLLNLREVDLAIEQRRLHWLAYQEALAGIEGVRLPVIPKDVDYNFSHFPIFVTPAFPVSRDEVYARLKEYDIHARRYFYPSVDSLPPYNRMRTGVSVSLEVSAELASQVLCLPLYPHLPASTPEKIAQILKNFLKQTQGLTS